ncbi:MAG: hypothetical protein IJU23_07960, partial [Proteobacteria bacterium]|nr:hypothetical protein [Pseudomonadota bacterium]
TSILAHIFSLTFPDFLLLTAYGFGYRLSAIRLTCGAIAYAPHRVAISLGPSSLDISHPPLMLL